MITGNFNLLKSRKSKIFLSFTTTTTTTDRQAYTHPKRLHVRGNDKAGSSGGWGGEFCSRKAPQLFFLLYLRPCLLACGLTVSKPYVQMNTIKIVLCKKHVFSSSASVNDRNI